MTAPFNFNKLETSGDGLVKQELITYERKDGVLKKITVSRKFFNNDYQDTRTEEIL